MYRNLQIEDKIYIQQYDKLKRIERDIMPTMFWNILIIEMFRISGT